MQLLSTPHHGIIQVCTLCVAVFYLPVNFVLLWSLSVAFIGVELDRGWSFPLQWMWVLPARMILTVKTVNRKSRAAATVVQQVSTCYLSLIYNMSYRKILSSWEHSSKQVRKIGTRGEETTRCCAHLVAHMKINMDVCRLLQNLQALRSCLNLLKRKKK